VSNFDYYYVTDLHLKMNASLNLECGRTRRLVIFLNIFHFFFLVHCCLKTLISIPFLAHHCLYWDQKRKLCGTPLLTVPNLS
jgi:hypothetical protein